MRVFLVEDVRATLVALAVQAVCTYGADGRHNRDYLAGNLDAIRATALAHHCAWVDVFADIRANLAPEHAAVLDGATAAMLEHRGDR